MKCQSQSGLLLLLIILAFCFLSGPAKAKGSEVQNEPYCDCRELFWILVDASIPFKVHTIKGQNCLVGQWKLSKQCCKICLNKIIKRASYFILFIEKYIFIINSKSYLYKDNSTCCKQNNNHANDKGNVILKCIHV